MITKPPEIDVPAQGNLLRSYSERIKNLPEDTKVIDSSWQNSWFDEKDFSQTMFRDDP